MSSGPLAVKQSITCGGRSALSICWWLAANPFSVKQSVIFDRETVNPGYSTSLFYISFLLPYIYCLISIIYYLLSKSVIYYLLPIIHYLYIFYLLSIIYTSLLSIADPQPWWMWCNICIVKAVENMKTAVINNLVIVFIYMLCENIHHYWGNVIRLIKLHCCCFFIYLHAFEFSGMQITQRKT